MKVKQIAFLWTLTLAGTLLAAPPAEIIVESPISNPEVSEEVKEPNRIEIKQDQNVGLVVESTNSLQDAANYANRDMTESACMIKCGSGWGFFARGEAAYDEYANRNATLIAQRLAYVEALENARKNLLAFVEGMTAEGKEFVQKELLEIDDSADSAGTRSVNQEFRVESAQTAAAGILQGYCIYTVKESDKNVTVSIVSTPLTRSGGIALSGGMTITGDYQEAFNKFYDELKSGALPPEGGKIFFVADNQGNVHAFFVSFGSEIIPQLADSKPALKRRTLEAAKQRASMRAAVNLCRLLTGDQVAWKNGFLSTTEKTDVGEGMAEAVKKLSEGALNSLGVNSDSVDRLQDKFINLRKTSEEFSAAAEGKIPPGTRKIFWEDEKGDWAYCMLIYSPAATEHVRLAKEAEYDGPGTKKADQPQENAKTKNASSREIKPIDSIEGDAASF